METTNCVESVTSGPSWPGSIYLDRALARLRFVPFAAMMLRSGPRSRRTVADLIERQAAALTDHCFVRFEGRALTYGELNAAANRIAHWAIGHGLGRGQVVALLMENRPEFLCTWAGLAKAGVTAALINTNLRGQALAHVLETSRAHRLIVGAECLPNFDSLPSGALDAVSVHVLADPADTAESALPNSFARLDAELAACGTDNPPRSVRSDLRAGDDLFFIYTSGTTGLPKAARFSHTRFFGACVHSVLKGFGREDTMYCALPLYHTVGGVMGVSTVLTAGGTLALRRRFSASRFWEDVVAMKATAFLYIGEFCRYLLHQPPNPAERAHRVRFVVGNGLRPDIWERFQRRFHIPHIVEFYGATEANVAMMNLDDKVGSIGKPAPGLKGTARVIRYDVDRDEHPRDAHGRCVECSAGEVGELIGRISSGRTARGRFEGYTTKEASERKILRDVFEKGDAWFRSGDLVRFDADGYFYFVDRIGDTFRWKGENVSTQEVAEALSGFAGVELCTVYGVPVPDADGRAGMAALTLHGGAALDGGELYDFVHRTLPGYAAPAFVRIPGQIDVTGTFKLRKFDLQAEGYDPIRVADPLYVRDDRSKAYVPLTSEVYQRLAAGDLRV